jgi:hypothetical protein
MPSPTTLLTVHPQQDTGYAALAQQGIDPTACTSVFVALPSLTWHRESVQPEAWERVYRDLTRSLKSVAPGSTVHLFYAGAYSFAMLAGRLLNPHLTTLKIYQYGQITGGGGAWSLWWPTLTDTRITHDTVFSTHGTAGDARDVALSVSVTHPIADKEMKLAFDRQQQRDVPVVSLTVARGASQTSITTANLAGAVTEILDALSSLAQVEGRTVHLFYSGPVALLLLIGLRAAILRCRVIVYERTQINEVWEFVPTVDLFAGRLLVCDIDRRALKNVLSELFGDVDRVGGVLVDAKIATTNINMKQSAGIVWYEAIEEAVKHCKLVELYRVALARYPENPELRAIGRFLWDPSRDR